MPTTITLMQDETPVKLTYDGVDRADPGPAGTVLKLLIAITERDEKTMRELIYSKTQSESKPNGSPGDVNIVFSMPTKEDDHWLVPTVTSGGGQQMPISFIVVEDHGKLKVDFDQTMERMMGPIMEAMGKAMEQVGQAMGQTMDAMGAAMKGAFGDESGSDNRGEHGNGNGESHEFIEPADEVPADEAQAEEKPTARKSEAQKRNKKNRGKGRD